MSSNALQTKCVLVYKVFRKKLPTCIKLINMLTVLNEARQICTEMVSIPRTIRKVTVLLYCEFCILLAKLPQVFTPDTLLCTTTATCTVLNSSLQYILNSTNIITTIARYSIFNSVIVTTINFVTGIVTL